VLPQSVKGPLALHMEKVSTLHQQDLQVGFGEAPLPRALVRKYPKAGYLLGWQFIFPSANRCVDPLTGRQVRFHIHEKTLQRTVKDAVAAAGINKPVSCHTFRHAFATHLLESGHNIRMVQELLGHKDVETTLIYTHVMHHSLGDVCSPADMLANISSTSSSDTHAHLGRLKSTSPAGAR